MAETRIVHSPLLKEQNLQFLPNVQHYGDYIYTKKVNTFPEGKSPQGEVLLEMCQMANIFIHTMCWQVASRYC